VAAGGDQHSLDHAAYFCGTMYCLPTSMWRQAYAGYQESIPEVSHLLTLTLAATIQRYREETLSLISGWRH